jgi:hypothetical protein
MEYQILFSPDGTGGTVSLKSRNPFDGPIINLNFLASKLDVVSQKPHVRPAPDMHPALPQHIMVTALKDLRRIVTSRSWNGYFRGFYSNELAKATSDAELERYIRANSGT